MHIGQALDRIGQGLFIDVGVFGLKALADGAILDRREGELVHRSTPYKKPGDGAPPPLLRPRGGHRRWRGRGTTMALNGQVL